MLGVVGSCWDEVPDAADCLVKARQGDAHSQMILGIMYHAGDGVPQDYKTAVWWYWRAAEQGLAIAQFSLGVMYDKGLGVVQDYKASVPRLKAAFKWYRKAAEQGHTGAQLNLGAMYAQGQGVLQDYVMAHMYFNIAAASGHEGAIEGRGFVEKEMTSSQIAEAQKLAREWMSKH